MSMDTSDVNKRTDRTNNVRFLLGLVHALEAHGLEVELDEFSTYEVGDSFTSTLCVSSGAPGTTTFFFDFAAGEADMRGENAVPEFYQIRLSASPDTVADTLEDRALERHADEYLVEEIETAMDYSAIGLLSVDQVAEAVAGAVDAADFGGQD